MSERIIGGGWQDAGDGWKIFEPYRVEQDVTVSARITVERDSDGTSLYCGYGCAHYTVNTCEMDWCGLFSEDLMGVSESCKTIRCAACLRATGEDKEVT